MDIVFKAKRNDLVPRKIMDKNGVVRTIMVIPEGADEKRIFGYHHPNGIRHIVSAKTENLAKRFISKKIKEKNPELSHFIHDEHFHSLATKKQIKEYNERIKKNPVLPMSIENIKEFDDAKKGRLLQKMVLSANKGNKEYRSEGFIQSASNALNVERGRIIRAIKLMEREGIV